MNSLYNSVKNIRLDQLQQQEQLNLSYRNASTFEVANVNGFQGGAFNSNQLSSVNIDPQLQHFLFFGGFRLYNSWLHNNRTGIGMKMSDIKLPMMYAKTYGTTTDAKTNISASALYKYLGLSKGRKMLKSLTN